MPSDSGLGLQAGIAVKCARSIVAVARAHHVVAAARSDLGPANPNAINAPGGGVTEVADLEVDSRELEDQGYQQGISSPVTV